MDLYLKQPTEACTSYPYKICLQKYLMLNPLKETRTTNIIDALVNHYLYIFSSPKHVLTDNGTNFVSQLMQDFENTLNIRHIRTTAFHPESNGALERTHALVKDLIRTALHGKDCNWDEKLNMICFGYNTASHDGIGITPFELTFGRKANLPLTISTTPALSKITLIHSWKQRHNAYIEAARKRIEANKEKHKKQQDARLIRYQQIFNEGDLVMLHNDSPTSKIDAEWLGPYTILTSNSPN